MIVVYMFLAAVIGYFVGAIPFGAIYVKLKTGKNITEIGSGRTGGTNSMRAAGVAVGFLTSFSDVFKGAATVLLTRWLFSDVVAPGLLPWLLISAGIFGVVGHNWSIYVKGAGGAGTGPNIGWATAVWWPIFPIGFAVMFVMIFIVGYASVGSIMMALVIPVTFAILYALGTVTSPVYILGGAITAGIVAFALRSNFRRLLRGEERLVGIRARMQKKRQEEAQSKTAGAKG